MRKSQKLISCAVFLGMVFLLLGTNPAHAKKYQVTVGYNGVEQKVIVVPGREEVKEIPIPAGNDPTVQGLLPPPQTVTTNPVPPVVRTPPTVSIPHNPAPHSEDGFPQLPTNAGGLITAAEIIAAVDTNGRVAFRTINFAGDAATLLPEAFPQLREIVKALDLRPAFNFTIEGHTASTISSPASTAFAQALSEDRARAVRSWLLNNGANTNQVTRSIGYGKSRPIASNDTEEGREKNRRVEISITP